MLSKDIQDEVIAFAQEIIRIESLSGDEGRVAAAIRTKMEMLGYDRVETDAYGSLIAYRQGSRPGPTILFDSHMDLVPVTNPDEWTSDPFGADIRDGKIYGRGSSDMKGPLAAAVVALGRLPNDDFAGTIAVSTSVLEEKHEGIALQAVMQRCHSDFVVICEPNGNTIGVGQKGRAGIWVDVSGSPAHSSVPHLGDNAVYKGIQVIERLHGMSLPIDEVVGEGVMELIDAISRPYPSRSTVPVGFYLRYDRRLVRGETQEGVLETTQQALAGLPGWQVGFQEIEMDTYTGQTLRGLDFHPAWAIDRGSEWIQKASRGLASAGIAPVYTTALFCTNGSYSAGTAGVPTMIFGPSSGQMAHRIDEYMPIDELLSGAEGYQGLARSLGTPLA
jgi:putative selenium metabolism hydrolase